MTTLADALDRFHSVAPHAATPDDIARGYAILDQLDTDQLDARARVLARLGSFHLEDRDSDPTRAIDQAVDCYAQVVTLANELQSIDTLVVGLSGGANALVRRYLHTRDPQLFEDAQGTFRLLAEHCDAHGRHRDAASFRINHAALLLNGHHGDRYARLETAEELLRGVIEQLSPSARGERFDPGMYSRALYDLGVALLLHEGAPDAETLKLGEAVAVLEEALEHRPAERDPVGRAKVKLALAKAYPNWSGADSLAHARELAERAEAEAKALLADLGRQPESLAHITSQRSALGWTLDELDDVALDRAVLRAHIEQHAHYLRQIPRERRPFLWAEWSGGHARLVGRIGVEDGDAEHVRLAYAGFVAALDTVTPERDPALHRSLSRALGRLCHQASLWEPSLIANGDAARVGMCLHDQAGTRISRGNELIGTVRAAHFGAYAAAMLDKPAEAIELAEMGCGLWLRDAFRVAEVQSSQVPSELKASMRAALAELTGLEQREQELLSSGLAGVVAGLRDFLGPAQGLMKARSTADPNGVERQRQADLREVRRQIAAARVTLGELIASAATLDSAILPPRLDAETIQTTARALGRPIVYLLATAWGSVALIAADTLESLPLPDLTRADVQRLLREHGALLSATQGHSSKDLEPALEATEQALSAPLIRPLFEWCERHGHRSLIVIGLGDVGLLPLQVAAIPAGLDLRFAPSARALARRRPLADAPCLMTLGDPASAELRPLPFARVESDLARSAFEREAATVRDLSTSPMLDDVARELEGATHVHLACHGKFRPSMPFESVLLLAGEEAMQVSWLMAPFLKLSSAELVVLSACNSGSEEAWRTPDEAIGFPATLLVAGARQVIAAQWEVSDVATLLLMHRFLPRMLDDDFEAAHALATAQRWLREAPPSQLVEAVSALERVVPEKRRRTRRLLRDLRVQLAKVDSSPFAARRHWAGFVCVGA